MITNHEAVFPLPHSDSEGCFPACVPVQITASPLDANFYITAGLTKATHWTVQRFDGHVTPPAVDGERALAFPMAHLMQSTEISSSFSAAAGLGFCRVKTSPLITTSQTQRRWREGERTQRLFSSVFTISCSLLCMPTRRESSVTLQNLPDRQSHSATPQYGKETFLLHLLVFICFSVIFPDSSEHELCMQKVQRFSPWHLLVGMRPWGAAAAGQSRQHWGRCTNGLMQ